METKNEEVIDQLNNLVEINNDRIEGYERAIGDTKDSDLKVLFADMASHSRTNKKELSEQVKTLGGKPAEGTKTSGKVFRAWMDFKAAITSKDRAQIIKSCEFGEDTALDTYEEVLESDVTIPESIRKIIEKQQAELKKDHDKMKRLKDMVESK